VTFRVRETFWNHGKIQSNTLLPTALETWSDAVNYIKGRQRAYTDKGYEEKQDEWWARNIDSLSVHRWTIEEDDED